MANDEVVNSVAFLATLFAHTCTAIKFGERSVMYVPVSEKAVVLHASCLFLNSLPFFNSFGSLS